MQKDNRNSSIHYISWGSGILLSLFSVSMITLVPHHNVMKQPKYWYEISIVGIFGWCSLIPANGMMIMKYLLDISFVTSWKSYWIIYAVSTVVSVSVFFGYYSIYSVLNNFFPPMPFGIAISGTYTTVAVFYTIWLRYACLQDGTTINP